jgi:RNA polymerase subunit RPABC4/transcription elongation factor Spt4
MKRCNSCGTVQEDENTFCGNCGQSLNSNFTYICNHCGRLFGASDLVCPKCGAKPGDTQDNNTTSSVVQPSVGTGVDLNKDIQTLINDVSDKVDNGLKSVQKSVEDIPNPITGCLKSAKESFDTVSDKAVTNIAVAKEKLFDTEKIKNNKGKILFALCLFILYAISTFGSYSYFSKQHQQKELALNADMKAPKIDYTITKVTPLKNMATIIADSVLLRVAPSPLSNYTKELSHGSKVEVITKDYCKDGSAAILTDDEVVFHDSRDGIVKVTKGSPLKITNSGKSSKLGTQSNIRYECDFTAVNGKKYNGPFNESQIKKMNDTLWYKVKFENTTGWIYSQYLYLDKD